MTTRSRSRPRLRPLAAALASGALAAVAIVATASARGDTPLPLDLPEPRRTALQQRAPAAVVIAAVFPDGRAPGDADEAAQVWNVGAAPVDLGGWALVDGGARAVFPAGARLEAGAWAWLTRDAVAFAATFGHAPDWAWGDAEGALRGHLVTVGGAPRLANAGGTLSLLPPAGRAAEPADAVAWGDAGDGSAAGKDSGGGDGGAAGNDDGGGQERTAHGAPHAVAQTDIPGWDGPGIAPYRTGAIGADGQMLYRKLDPDAGRPVADTDSAADWAGDPRDPVLGRRARRPGWDLESRLAPVAVREPAHVALAIAPDGLFAFLARHIDSAARSIDLLAYSVEHPDLALRLAARARAGVRVRLMVDGAPAGGHDPTGRWCLALLDAAGADVRFMDDGGDVKRRYRGAHAKLMVVDDRVALIGTENPTLASAPAAGGAGRRGAWLATDAPSVVAWARGIVAADVDPAAHVDVRPFQARDPIRGAPAPDVTPAVDVAAPGYDPAWGATVATAGTFRWELISAPENALHPTRGLLGLLAAAGPGDVVRVAQLREPLWWGGGARERVQGGAGDVARNPRAVAYLEAARRGARVRVLLDGYFDDPAEPNSNAALATWLNGVAGMEGLDLVAHVGNPTGRGIHAKIVLVERADGVRWTHLGSLNGTEVASKLNRELAVQVDAPAVHDRLAEAFDADWAASERRTAWLPWAGR